jgi:O-antigen ligase
VKWVVLFVVLAGIVPLSGWLRRNPGETPKFWMLLGLLPFVLGAHIKPIPEAPLFHLYLAFVSWPEWPGYVKGAEFSLLDALALSLYLSLPATRHPLPFRFSMAFYLVAISLSAFQAWVPMAALFYSWQIARMFLVYAAVAKGGAADPRVVPALLKGMAAALIVEAGISILQRFAFGLLQASGTLDHQNLLGLMSHLIVFPVFALILAGQRGWLIYAVALAGIIVEVLTTSRATVGLAGFGYAAVFMLSALRQWSSRKATVLVMGLVMMAVLVPLALSSFERRFSAEGSSDYDERGAFQAAAGMILSDHPLGAGANNYVVVANTGGYNAKAGVAAARGSESANVHNVYWLVAAETGYPGLIAFVLLLLPPMVVAFRCGWRNRKDPRGDLLLGLGVALLTVYLHCFVEWIFVTYQAQYMFAIEVGLVAGLAQQLGYWRRLVPQPVRADAGILSVRPTRQMIGGVGGRSRALEGPVGDRPNGLTGR